MKEFSAQKLLQVIDLCRVNGLSVYTEYCGEWIKNHTELLCEIHVR